LDKYKKHNSQSFQNTLATATFITVALPVVKPGKVEWPVLATRTVRDKNNARDVCTVHTQLGRKVASSSDIMEFRYVGASATVQNTVKQKGILPSIF
jgi:hypothetical protein